MNARSLRRLAGDHASLHTSPLPPNYLFAPAQSADDSSDLTSLDILLAGPTSTPYEAGVFKLHLSIPETYPNEPPKAFFRTKIFHPNVDDSTGAVCLETLKRDWDSKLTLRDILVTICCLLLQPNASSALNAEAGMLLEQGDDGWDAFDRRARFMTKLHGSTPKEWREAVREAQTRGEEGSEEARPDTQRQDSGVDVMERRRGRRRRAEVHTPLLQHMDNDGPTDLMQEPEKRSFAIDSVQDDVFSIQAPPSTATDAATESQHGDQENADSASSSTNHRRASAMPLSELQISDDSFEAEYPPSPKKSPTKRALRTVQDQENDLSILNTSHTQAESSLTAAIRQPLLTPQSQAQPEDSLSMFTIRKPARPVRSSRRHATPVDSFDVSKVAGKVGKKHGGGGRKTADERRKEKLESRLWQVCGGDVERWNRGDFGGVANIRMARW